MHYTTAAIMHQEAWTKNGYSSCCKLPPVSFMHSTSVGFHIVASARQHNSP